MAKRNRKLRNELNELEQSERNLYLINSKNDNISNRMDGCLLYTSPSPRDKRQSRMPSSA